MMALYPKKMIIFLSFVLVSFSPFTTTLSVQRHQVWENFLVQAKEALDIDIDDWLPVSSDNYSCKLAQGCLPASISLCPHNRWRTNTLRCFHDISPLVSPDKPWHRDIPSLFPSEKGFVGWGWFCLTTWRSSARNGRSRSRDREVAVDSMNVKRTFVVSQGSG